MRHYRYFVSELCVTNASSRIIITTTTTTRAEVKLLWYDLSQSVGSRCKSEVFG